MKLKYGQSSGNGHKVSTQRLDKWLWYTRIVKSRTLAATLIGGGKVRVNRQRVTKASYMLKLGDVVTAMVAKKVRVLKMLEAGHRRGPALEAQGLYEDLSPEIGTSPSVKHEGGGLSLGAQDRGKFPENVFSRSRGSGRPTKRDRRKIDRLKSGQR